MIINSEDTPLVTQTSSEKSKHKKIVFEIAIALLAILNGTLFFAIAAEGKNSLSRTLHEKNKAIDEFSIFSNVICAISYAAFFRSALKNIHLRPNNPAALTFCLFAPFAASAYCSSGIEGAKSLSLSSTIANTTGVALFLLRILNCVDGANRFPDQLKSMRDTWRNAYQSKNYAECMRLISAITITSAYCIASTDAFFYSTETLLRFAQCPIETAARVACYVACALGVIGTLPLSLYWTHRGILEVTNNKPIKTNSLDPSIAARDRYTLIAMLITLFTITGTLGAASNKKCAIFCSLGAWTAYISIPASMLYAVFSGIPGISNTLRDLFSRKEAAHTIPSENLTLQTQP
ncbi:MAG: hypothetical protein COY58_02770 [Gammaproteobacteria bacterium CG_4_10_14_0_8_um_filter_38_16]|nr:MAG: hypothetical protein COY58_02770 [Gammaproteobacteria bacterium CG_4_10_14_0_8_um_filter_38_16]PJA03853.1 MAG: hypothetical protein COX72_02930 [Gammaproteobacteria bacterium CG_4_10_14_0_2_um_filter_38_22]PJB10826.1 MAG: hypothetical protein CO120_03035 [Gammaproteobacteria bacterium CG_4_9_14_3_um_filter_38_9]